MIINGFTLKSSNAFQKSIIITVPICIIISFGGGFLIPVYKMPYFMQMLNFPNMLKIYFELFLIDIYQGRCDLTSSVFNSFGIAESQLTYNLYILLIEGTVLRIFGFIITLLQSNPKYFIK